MQCRVAGTLPFEYQDRAIQSTSFDDIFAAPDSLAAFSQDRVLMGSLTEVPSFTQDLRKSVTSIELQLLG